METSAFTWATKALEELKEEKKQMGLDFEVYFWGALVVRWHLGKVFVFFGCVSLCFNFSFTGAWDKLERHIAPALVQQAGGEDQCDTIPAQALQDLYKCEKFFDGIF